MGLHTEKPAHRCLARRDGPALDSIKEHTRMIAHRPYLYPRPVNRGPVPLAGWKRRTMTTSVVARALQSASLTLTVRVEGMPAVHFTYDHTRPFKETAVTIVDQSASGPAWSFEEVVWQALSFLLCCRAQR